MSAEGRGRRWTTRRDELDDSLDVTEQGEDDSSSPRVNAATGINAVLSPTLSAEFETSTRGENSADKPPPPPSRRQPQLQTSGSVNFGGTSISEAIDASETLEEFEERERQIVRQLDYEALSRAQERSQNSAPSRSSNLHQYSPTLEGSDAPSEQTVLGYPREPPPAYQMRDRSGQPQGGGLARVRTMTGESHSSAASPANSVVGYEPPTPPASMAFSGFAVPAPDDFQRFDGTDALSVGPPATATRNSSRASSVTASAIGSSFALAGGMAAVVAGSHTPQALPITDTVYGSDLPSRPAPTQNYYYESTNRRSSPAAADPDKDHPAGDPTAPLPVTADLEAVVSYVFGYTAETVEIEPVLQPFLLDYIPAVGDVDPFIKIPRPDREDSQLGLVVLDEPSERQSDSAMIDLRLHQRLKSAAAGDVPVKALGRADRNKRQIERWIESTREARKSRPLDRVNFGLAGAMPDVETLMQEWPEPLEQLFSRETVPSAKLDLSLTDYADICLALADVPVREGCRVQAMHVLFSLYLEFRNSQHFRSIAAAANSTTKNNTYNNERNHNNNNEHKAHRSNSSKRASGSSVSSAVATLGQNNNRSELS